MLNINTLMADDFYNIKRLYEDYSVGSNQSNYPAGVTYDSKNSYNTTSSMSGPGNGPQTITGGAPSTGDLVHWKDQPLTPEQALEIAEEVLDHEIDQADAKDMDYAVQALKRVQRVLLHVQMTS